MDKPKSLHDLPPDFVFDPARASQMMTRHGHGGWLGISYHDHGPDWVELSLPWRGELVAVAETGVLAPVAAEVSDAARAVAKSLLGGEHKAILLGNAAAHHARPPRRLHARGRSGPDGDRPRRMLQADPHDQLHPWHRL